MYKKFPIIKAGHIFNSFKGDLLHIPRIVMKEINIKYPCRLDAMAINPSAVTYNDKMVFTPGEVVISINRYIKVKVEVVSETGGEIIITKTTKRKSLVKHSFLIMCKALNVSPSLKINVDDSDILKHCGFGSSSSTIAAVASAINEIYGNPIQHEDLIKYLASNHGEEISDEDEDNLKVVQCIGGGATNGLTEEGIIVIAGKSTKIAKMFYEGEVLIGIPNDFVQKDANELMELEEKNLWKFKETGDKYSEKIAFNILHNALPDMANNSIKGLADIVYDYRFNMGSNQNCSFVYDGLAEIGEKLRCLYENHDCEFLALSSVGPAYFVIVNNDKQAKTCTKKMKELDLKIYETTICNTKYIVEDTKTEKAFWQDKETNKEFQERKPSSYITNVIDEIGVKNKMCIDIGCGGGRYSKYLIKNKANALAVDKYSEMIGDTHDKKINFINATMTNIPVLNESYDLALSIGVIHNAQSIEELHQAFEEIHRILVKGGKAIVSIFTNDYISDDLEECDNGVYKVLNRDPMVLLSKQEIDNYVKQIGFKIVKKVDEHLTDVGSGKRNVYTFLLEK